MGTEISKSKCFVKKFVNIFFKDTDGFLNRNIIIRTSNMKIIYSGHWHDIPETILGKIVLDFYYDKYDNFNFITEE